MAHDAGAAAHPNWAGHDLGELLQLEAQGDAVWHSRRGDRNINGRAFGGQLLGQAAWAAVQTVPADRRLHMLQALFLRGAEPDVPVEYRVKPQLEGSRYSGRVVSASQNGKAVLEAQLSFQVPLESQLAHYRPPGFDIPAPEDLPGLDELAQRYPDRLGARGRITHGVEMRPLDGRLLIDNPDGESRLRYWMRQKARVADDPQLRDAAMAHLSDYYVNFASYMRYVAFDQLRQIYVASLNHALWLHAPANANDWLLFDSDGIWAGNNRGLTVTRVYDRAATLVATVTQECVIGPRKPD